MKTKKYFDGEQELILKIYINEDKAYYNSKGQPHRADGPAVELYSGSKIWYKNGKLHRFDGPAEELADGRKYWHYEGEYINRSSQEEFERYLKALILK